MHRITRPTPARPTPASPAHPTSLRPVRQTRSVRPARRTRLGPSTAILTLALTSSFLLPALAPTQAEAQNLPAAAELIDRHLDAIGGAEQVSERMASSARGTFSMAAAGLQGDMEVHSSAQGQMLVRITIPGVGEILSGYDGNVAWDIDPFQGPRVLSGAEAEQRAMQVDLGYYLRSAETFPTRETVERTEMGGEACYRVRLVTASGSESFDCYSAETGRMVATEMTVETMGGPVNSLTLFRDYQDFGGMMVATRTEQTVMGMQQVLTIDELEFGEPDASLFELPAPIRTLVEGN